MQTGSWVWYYGHALINGDRPPGLYRFSGPVSPSWKRGRIRTASTGSDGFYSIYEVDMIFLRLATEQEILFYSPDDQSSTLP